MRWTYRQSRQDATVLVRKETVSQEHENGGVLFGTAAESGQLKEGPASDKGEMEGSGQATYDAEAERAVEPRGPKIRYDEGAIRRKMGFASPLLFLYGSARVLSGWSIVRA